MLRVAATGLALLCLLSGNAVAEERASQEREAKTLLDQSQTLMDQGDMREARPERAPRADQGLARMMLASCFDRLGRTATAWREYLVVAKLASQNDKEIQREMMALDRAKTLENKLVRLTIRAPKDIVGLVVQRGGATVATEDLGVAVPVDPGEIHVSATAPGYEPFTTSVKIAKEKLTTVEVPQLRKMGP